jgi:predicted PurR-regulated permease PerM
MPILGGATMETNESVKGDGSHDETEANAMAFAKGLDSLMERGAKPDLPVFLSWRALARMGITVLLVAMASLHWQSVTNGIGFVMAAVWPVILALIISYIAGIPLAFFERQYSRLFKGRHADSLRKPLCLLLTVLIAMAIAFLVLFVALPEFANAVTTIINLLPGYLRQLQSWIDTTSFAGNVESILPGGLAGLATEIEHTDIGALIMSLFAGAGNGISPDSMIAAAASVMTSVTNVFIAILLAFSFLMEQETLQNHASRIMAIALGPERNRSANHILHVADECFHGYFVGTFLGAIVQGAGSWLLLTLTGNQFAASIGVLVGITALIPAIGPIIGMILGCFLSFAISIPSMFIALIIITVIQQLWQAFLYPMFVDRSLGLPAMWILVAIIIGGVGGITGMAVAVPLAAIAYRLLQAVITRYEEKHGMDGRTEPRETAQAPDPV